MFPHEFDEPASTKVGLLNISFFPIDLDKLLGMLAADGYHQPASLNQLIDQHFWHLRGAGRHQLRLVALPFQRPVIFAAHCGASAEVADPTIRSPLAGASRRAGSKRSPPAEPTTSYR